MKGPVEGKQIDALRGGDRVETVVAESQDASLSSCSFMPSA